MNEAVLFAALLGYLLLAFILLPAVELFLLIQVGLRIGWPETLAIILTTGLLGAYLAQRQGTHAWRDVREKMAHGKVPGTELVAGALFLVGAAFLLTPGIITDIVGFALMVPRIRRATAKMLIHRLKDKVTVVHIGGQGGPARTRQDDDVVDVEYERETP